ncbi:deoxyribonuclease V [Spirulina sp. 06S082]|uniref:deoxyribonuclease V n=1 Tax=Spirulina sp. 06S082 TaxID=3110248 RepID=UPI002B21BA1D|nr:deoxyribonuclease V [Spirulina sp. 06S082]MEA5467285.1 deoxyribonuclease V [Spirulina sp. 06S082]
MKLNIEHNWSPTEAEAKQIQADLRDRVIKSDSFTEIRYVAGVDAGFEKDDSTTKAAVVVLSFPDLKPVDRATARIPTNFPYIPGFLSFREIPALIEAIGQLTTIPDLILCDGQGYAHPRRFGLACHLGVLLDLPTIGVAKTRFIGQHEEIPIERGSWQPLRDEGEIIGAVLRSQTNIKPLYISIGHKISLPTAIDYVLRCAPRYRLPETTRLADRLAS